MYKVDKVLKLVFLMAKIMLWQMKMELKDRPKSGEFYDMSVELESCVDDLNTDREVWNSERDKYK